MKMLKVNVVSKRKDLSMWQLIKFMTITYNNSYKLQLLYTVLREININNNEIYIFKKSLENNNDIERYKDSFNKIKFKNTIQLKLGENEKEFFKYFNRIDRPIIVRIKNGELVNFVSKNDIIEIDQLSFHCPLDITYILLKDIISVIFSDFVLIPIIKRIEQMFKNYLTNKNSRIVKVFDNKICNYVIIEEIIISADKGNVIFANECIKSLEKILTKQEKITGEYKIIYKKIVI